MEKLQRQHFRGLLPILALAVIAYVLHHYTGILGSVVWGLILGLIVGNTYSTPHSFKMGVKYSEKTVLAYAIILMGIPTGASFRSEIPWSAGLIVLIVMAITILSGLLLYRVFKLSKDNGLLIGIGNAICGASAIAAISGIIKSDAKETGTSIAVINVLGILGLIILPPTLIALDTDTLSSALYTGGTMQALGQAVAAGEAVSQETGLWATTIKLFRVSMLLPIAILVALSTGRKHSKDVSLKLIPTFLWLFIGTAVIGFVEVLPDEISDAIRLIEKALLTIAMVGIGWQIKFANLKSEGPRSMLMGTLIFIIQIISMAVLIHLFQPSFG